MKNPANKRSFWLSTVLCLLPVAAGLWAYPLLPDQVVTHWGPSGQPDGYSSRAMAALGLPLAMTGLHLLLWFFLSNDPRNRGASNPILSMGRWSVPVISAGVQGFILWNALAGPVDPTLPVILSMGIMFTVLGNYLPKCRPSYTAGFRLPWTLHDEENWTRTHRLAGWVWTAGGIVILATAFFRAIWLMTGILTLMVLVPSVYSYLLYRRKKTES